MGETQPPGPTTPRPSPLQRGPAEKVLQEEDRFLWGWVGGLSVFSPKQEAGPRRG